MSSGRSVALVSVISLLAFACAKSQNQQEAGDPKLPFEAVFQGLCEKHQPCEQLCFNMHESTFECSCRPGYVLNPDGYSCSKLNMTNPSWEGTAVLYEKEASFVAILDDYPADDTGQDYPESPPHTASLRTGPAAMPLIAKADIINYEKYKREHRTRPEDPFGRPKEDELGIGELGLGAARREPMTSPGPNLEQKVPSSAIPDLQATESLAPQCHLNCGFGKCSIQAGYPRCQCPLGYSSRHCHPEHNIEVARFHGASWVGFAPLREAYRDVQLTLEFKPESPDGVLLVSGENDDLAGDFMAAIISARYIEFRWDCGSGAGLVRSSEPVKLGAWNRLTVYRHRWDVWLQLNNGRHVQGRSDGLFSRITFREPLYVGGSFNLTSLLGRLGVGSGFVGCIRRMQVNDHVYRFRRMQVVPDVLRGDSFYYDATDGWDISECSGDACSDLECFHGGKCLAGPQGASSSSASDPSHTSFTGATCVCPLGFTGEYCEEQLNLDVPSFNGSSHLVFPSLGKTVLSWLELEVIFKPFAGNGIILHEAHRADNSADSISLVLSESHVLFLIDLGSGPLTLRTPEPIELGIWHLARVSRTGRRVWLYVDSQPPLEGLTPGGFTMLTLVGPLYLGGLPAVPHLRPPLPSLENFSGCIQKVSLSGRSIPMVSGALSGSNVASCDHPCSQKPCDNGGICEPNGPLYSCKCPLGFKDDHCRSRILTQVARPRFSGRSFLKYVDPEITKRISGDRLHVWLKFKSTSKDGLLLWAGEQWDDGEDALPGTSSGDSFSLQLAKGRLVLKYNLGSGFGVLTYSILQDLDDGEWHLLRLSRFEREARLSVDGEDEEAVISPGDLIQLNVDSPLYVGGREGGFSSKETEDTRTPGFSGCLSDLILATDYHVDLITQASAGQNIDYC